MKITRLNDAEVGIPDYQVVISSKYNQTSWGRPSKVVLVWRDGEYLIRESGGKSMVTVVGGANLLVAWRKDEERPSHQCAARLWGLKD